MASHQEELRSRTKKFALDVIRLSRTFPNRPEGWVIAKQVLRSGTSVAANYRAAGRGRSHAEFTAKLGVVVEEADETVFWLELLKDADVVPATAIEPLLSEANQLLAIFAASLRTARGHAQRWRDDPMARWPDHPVSFAAAASQPLQSFFPW